MVLGYAGPGGRARRAGRDLGASAPESGRLPATWLQPGMDPVPAEKDVDVCRAADGSRLDIEFVGQDGVLSGEEVLPGFELAMSKLFPASENA